MRRLSCPILADKPGVRSLEAGFGFRHSDYASAGGADTWKAELIYQPVESVRLRGSYQRAARVPSIYELYRPQLPTAVFIDQPDPCSVDSDQRNGPDGARVEALCLGQGLPAALLPSFRSEFIEAEGLSGGNPDLEPEDATTYTTGVVFRAPFDSPLWSDLQVSLDWYRIEIENVIDFRVAPTSSSPTAMTPISIPSTRLTTAGAHISGATAAQDRSLTRLRSTRTSP